MRLHNFILIFSYLMFAGSRQVTTQGVIGKMTLVHADLIDQGIL